MFRPGHEKRTNLYHKSRSPVPMKLEIKRQVKASGVKDPQSINNMTSSIKSVRRFSNEKMVSPAAAKALGKLNPKEGYVMLSESKKPYDMGYGTTTHHTSGGSRGGSIPGNRRPSDVGKAIMKGAPRFERSTYYKD